MAVQKQINLNEPLDAKASSALKSFDLTPEYSEAALLLHGDRYRQFQSALSRNAFWNSGTVTFFVLAIAVFFSYQLRDYIAVSDDIAEFFKLVSRSKDLRFELLMTFPYLLFLMALVGLSAYILADEFKGISDGLLEEKFTEYFFGFDIGKFAKLSTDTKNPKELKLLANGRNSHLIEYREQAIGVVTLRPLVENSTSENFYVRISGLSIRRMFKQFDFDQLLLDWAFQRAKTLYKEYQADKKLESTAGCKITLLIENYSFDKAGTKFLEQNRFTKVGSAYNFNPLNENTGVWNNVFLKVFGLTKDAYAVHLVDTGSQTTN